MFEHVLDDLYPDNHREFGQIKKAMTKQKCRTHASCKKRTLLRPKPKAVAKAKSAPALAPLPVPAVAAAQPKAVAKAKAAPALAPPPVPAAAGEYMDVFSRVASLSFLWFFARSMLTAHTKNT